MAGEELEQQLAELPEGWTVARLGDMISLRGGLSYKGEFLSDSGNSLVTMGCVSASERFKKSGLKRYSGDFTERHRLRVGDMVIATRDVTQNRELLGSPALVPEGLPGAAVIAATNLYMVSNHSESPTEFLYWLMKTPAYRNQIVASAKGTTIVMLTKDSVENFTFPLPPLAEQKAIAAVLGALDDKIELNRRMNATLEAMARALFQSWFVDFDPVRAKLDGRQPPNLDPATAALFPNSFQDSDLGHIPKGWEVGQLGQYLTTEIGGDWGEDDRFDGAIEVAALRGVDLEHLRERGDANPPHRWIKESSLTKRRMSACDVLVASSGAGPCGRPLWVSPHLEAAFPVPVLYSNFCKRYRAATPAHALYFDRVLLEMRASGEIWDFINGTSLPNLDSNGLMTGKSVLVPPPNILAKFAEFVEPLYERLYSHESRTLATLRDTLLPRLLSGELSVTETH